MRNQALSQGPGKIVLYNTEYMLRIEGGTPSLVTRNPPPPASPRVDCGDPLFLEHRKHLDNRHGKAHILPIKRCYAPARAVRGSRHSAVDNRQLTGDGAATACLWVGYQGRVETRVLRSQTPIGHEILVSPF